MDKALERHQFITAEPMGMPRVEEVHESPDGTGLEVSGWFATFDEDTDNESFLAHAFDKAIPSALAVGVPVLYNHQKNQPPVGFVKSCKVTARGLYGSIILPAAEIGTRAYEIFMAAKNGLLKFSVGGVWSRKSIAGRVRLMCDRWLELSLTGTPTNQYAVTDAISAVSVKSIGGVWVPDFDSRWDAAVAEHLQPRLDLVALKLGIAAMRSRH